MKEQHGTIDKHKIIQGSITETAKRRKKLRKINFLYDPKQVHCCSKIQSVNDFLSQLLSVLSFLHGGQPEICNGHFAGTRNAGNNFISICLQFAGTDFKLFKLNIVCFGDTTTASSSKKYQKPILKELHSAKALPPQPQSLELLAQQL